RVTLGSNLAVLDSDAALFDVRSRGADIVSTVVIGDAVRVANVPLSCADLTLDAPPVSTPESDPVGDDTWVPAHRTLTIRAQPGRGDRLDVRIDPSRQWPVLLERIEHRGTWGHVRLAQQNGVLEGWVRSTDLRRPGFSGHIAMQATD